MAEQISYGYKVFANEDEYGNEYGNEYETEPDFEGLKAIHDFVYMEGVINTLEGPLVLYRNARC